MLPTIWMVFDVESIGLHGETFAVGAAVIDRSGLTLEHFLFACNPDLAAGSDEGRNWIEQNCPVIPANCGSPRDVRNQFWQAWLKWKAQGAGLVADFAWPVEARFLAACVDDSPDGRGFSGPFPLHELASFMVAAGMNPHADYPRLPEETAHDPLGDARQSARLLIAALDMIAPRSRERSTA